MTVFRFIAHFLGLSGKYFLQVFAPLQIRGVDIVRFLDRYFLTISIHDKIVATFCILIAGKGHENYQDVQGVKHHFSDFEIAEKALAELG